MIIKLENHSPIIDESAWVADNAAVIGEVEMGENSSVWYSASVRADEGFIKIGKNSNIQDNTVIHVTPGYPVTVGDNTTVGHNVILHGCTVGENVVIGMGAIILNGAKIGDNVIIGAGALVTEGKEIPSNSLAFGSPAKVMRELKPEEVESNKKNTMEYVALAKRHKKSVRVDK